MMNNKKGMEGAYFKVISIVLTVAGFVLIIGLTTDLSAKIFSNPEEKGCTASIQLAAKLREASFIGEYTPVPWPPQCITQDVIIKDKTALKVENKMINLMERCWKMMGEGKVAAFDQKLFSTESGCFTCFTFSATGINEPIKKNDFTNYLATKKASNGEVYAEYLKGDGKNPNDLFLLTDIEKDVSYSVIYTDKEQLGKLVLPLTAGSSAIAGGVAGGIAAGAISGAGTGAAIGAVGGPIGAVLVGAGAGIVGGLIGALANIALSDIADTVMILPTNAVGSECLG